jgi:hypothetical protein
MASPNSVFTELVTTTFRKHGKQFRDNMSNHNALLRRMHRKGMSRSEDGGLSIVEPLDYAQNSTYQRFSGYDVLNIGASDVLSAAEYQWRQIALSVASSGEELRKNRGQARIINLAKSRITNALRTFKNNFSSDVYSDGTLSNQVNGLQALISDAGTGTVGGIDSSVWTFWQNKVQSAAAPLQGGGAITPSAATIQSLWLPLWLELTRGEDKPDLIVTDNNYFTFYEESLTSYKRYAGDAETARGGFVELKYKTADVIFDGGSGIPTNHAYFINTDYFTLVHHPDANMTVNEEMRPINQDAAIVPVLWMGNLVCGNRSLQGVQKA